MDRLGTGKSRRGWARATAPGREVFRGACIEVMSILMHNSHADTRPSAHPPPFCTGPTSSGAHEGTVSWRDGCILLSAKQLGVSAGENEQLWMVLYEQEGIQHALCAPQLLVRYEGQSKLECPTLAEVRLLEQHGDRGVGENKQGAWRHGQQLLPLLLCTSEPPTQQEQGA